MARATPPSSHSFVLAAVLLATVLLLGWAVAVPVAWLDAWLGDLRMALASRPLADGPGSQEAQAARAERGVPEIVIVSIDDRSVRDLPYRDPLDRAYLADLLTQLAAKEVAAIGLYVPLDRHSEAEKDRLLRERFTTLEVPFAALRHVPRDAFDRSLLERLSETDKDGESIEALDEKRQAQAFQDQMFSGIPSGHDVVLIDQRIGTPRQIIAAPEKSGFGRGIPERGGPERAAGQAKAGTRYGPPFAAAFASVVSGKPPTVLPRPIRFSAPVAGEAPFRMVSADLVAGIEKSALQGRIILVGAGMRQTDKIRTIFATYDSAYRNILPVQLQAHIVQDILSSSSPLPVTPGWMNPVFVLLMGGLGCAVVLLFRKAKIRLVLAALITLSFLGLTPWLAIESGYRLAPLSPLLAFFAAMIATASYEILSSYYARRRLIQGLAGRLPKVQHHRALPTALAMTAGGIEGNATVLVSRLRPFDQLPQGDRARESVELLRALAHRQRQLVWRHGGFLLNHQDGGCVALFGGFGDDPHHAAHAVSCADAMEIFAHHHADGLMSQALDKIRFDFGVASGPLLMGDVGGEDVLECAAAGPALRLAMRLCRHNASLGTRIAVSAACAKAARATGNVPGSFRPVADLLWPESSPVRVMELLPRPKGPLAMGAKARLKSYREAFKLLEQDDGQQSPMLLEIFRTLLQADPEDAVVAFHLHRLTKGQSGSLIRLRDER